MAHVKKGDKVSWKWGSGHAHGTVAERHADAVERTIKGETITRHGKADNAALVIEQEDGGKVLKLESEVDKA